MGARPDQEWSASAVAALNDGYAAGLSDAEIAELVGKSVRSVAAKRNRLNLSRHIGPRPAPEDLRELCKTMQHRELRAHYVCSYETISRWMKEQGIPPLPRPKRAEKPKTPKPAKPPKTTTKRHRYSGPTLAPVTIEDSRAARAARFLMRRFTPVCRATIVEPKAGKDLWIVGRNIMTSGEMIDKAASDPAWERYAS